MLASKFRQSEVFQVEMFRFSVFFAVVACAYAGAVPLATVPQLDGRIVGGHDTTIEDHPHQVSLQSVYGSHFCGGSIINEDTVVTAAHCVSGRTPSSLKIRLGSTHHHQNGDVVEVRALKMHEQYNPYTFTNDVAVIKLSHPVRESSKVKFIKLAKITPLSGAKAQVTGWGAQSQGSPNLPETLQEVDVSILRWKKCGSDNYEYGQQVQKSMVCAYADYKDACQGDSGGPLVSGNRLVGIVSWGYGCAQPGYPGVYSDVPVTRDWIEKTAAEL